MAQGVAIALLTSIVVLPALGSLIVAALGHIRETLATRVAIGFAGATVGLASWILWTSSKPAHLSLAEIHTWIPALGVSIALDGDGPTFILLVWVALSSVLTVALTRPNSRTASLVLFLEAMVLTLFLARDVFLVAASLGGICVAAALVSSAPRKVLVFESAGLTVLLGWFAWIYGMVYVQTGFVSTELARWQSLVLYPDEARTLFLLGSFTAVSLILAIGLAMETAPRAGRLALSAIVVPLGSYFVLRVLVPLSWSAAETIANSVLVFAAILMASTFFARGWVWVALGCQGLVLFGLFSLREEGVVGALLMMLAAAAGGFGIELVRNRSLVWFFAIFMIGVALASVIAPAWAGEPLFAALGTFGFAVMAYRIVALAVAFGKTLPVAPARRSSLWFAVPVVLWSVSMVIGWRAWETRFEPWGRELVSPSSLERLP
jgi:NADH-quinone oxidoreductase subunit M